MVILSKHAFKRLDQRMDALAGGWTEVCAEVEEIRRTVFAVHREQATRILELERENEALRRALNVQEAA